MYIHSSICISPQQTYSDVNIDTLHASRSNKLKAIEPKYQGIPLNLLRRMGKAVRIGVGAALPLITKDVDINGIILGTANGGMEDCIKFLNQIIEFEEGALTPTNFVQSTPNAISSQIGLLSANFAYNITHVHRGHSFENALLDAMMLLKENPKHQYLVAGVDEISTYNFNIDFLAGWYKKEEISNDKLYESSSEGSIAGEGAAVYLVNNNPEGALAKIEAIETTDTSDKSSMLGVLENLIEKKEFDVLLSGENGDIRMSPYYQAVEDMTSDTPILRYKHMSGEYPTSTSFALWLAMQKGSYPDHMIKKGRITESGKILIYNTYKGQQHSFILVSKV